MKITEIYIKSFGGLKDCRVRLKDGLNTVNKENGFGKTTLTVFIKSMFYGLDNTKKTKLDENDRRRYLPWDGSLAGGSLTFMHSERTYRIERTFSQKANEDTFKLYDERNGKASADFTESIGEELFGIDANGFLRTVFLSEQNISGKSDNKTVSAKLSDLVGASGDIGEMDGALLALDNKRKELRRRGDAGRLPELEARMRRVQRDISEASGSKSSLGTEETALYEMKERLAGLDREIKRLSELEISESNKKIHRENILKYIKKRSEYEAEYRESVSKLGGAIPTDEEISSARSAEGTVRNSASFINERGDEAYTELVLFFADGRDKRDTELLGRLSQNIERLEEDIRTLEGEIGSLPMHTAEEYESAFEDYKSRIGSGKKKRAIFPTVLAVLAALCLIPAISSPIFLIAAGVLAAVSALLFLLPKNRAAKSPDAIAARAKLEKLLGNEPLLDTELTDAVRNASERAAERSAKKALIEEKRAEISKASREACEIIKDFPIKSRGSVTEAYKEINEKRTQFDFAQRAMSGSRESRDRLELQRKDALRLLRSFQDRYGRGYRTVEETASIQAKAKNAERRIDELNSDIRKIMLENGIGEEMLAESRDGSSGNASEMLGKLKEERNALQRSVTLKESSCDLLSDSAEAIDSLNDEYAELAEEHERLEADLTTVKNTYEYLNRAKDRLTERYLSKTKAALSKYLSEIGGESAESFSIDTSFALKKSEGGSYRDAEAYSMGMRDLYALAVRFALVDSLFANEKPFIILDDPFVHFDGERLKRAKRAISIIAKEKQVIYLTCSEERNI